MKCSNKNTVGFTLVCVLMTNSYIKLDAIIAKILDHNLILQQPLLCNSFHAYHFSSLRSKCHPINVYSIMLQRGQIFMKWPIVHKKLNYSSLWFWQQWKINFFLTLWIFDLKMESTRSFKILVPIHQTEYPQTFTMNQQCTTSFVSHAKITLQLHSE